MHFAWSNRVRDRPSDVPERFRPRTRNRLFDTKRPVRIFEDLRMLLPVRRAQRCADCALKPRPEIGTGPPVIVADFGCRDDERQRPLHPCCRNPVPARFASHQIKHCKQMAGIEVMLKPVNRGPAARGPQYRKMCGKTGIQLIERSDAGPVARLCNGLNCSPFAQLTPFPRRA